MKSHPSEDGANVAGGAHFREPTLEEVGRAWEEVDRGRFLPRRIRGSYLGRALG